MYGCQSRHVNEWCWSSSTSTCEKEKWWWWWWWWSSCYSSGIIDPQLFTMKFVRIVLNLFSPTHFLITYFRIRKESIKVKESHWHWQGRAWSTDLRISINRSLIGSFHRWNSNDPGNELTCRCTQIFSD